MLKFVGKESPWSVKRIGEASGIGEGWDWEEAHVRMAAKSTNTLTCSGPIPCWAGPNFARPILECKLIHSPPPCGNHLQFLSLLLPLNELHRYKFLPTYSLDNQLNFSIKLMMLWQYKYITLRMFSIHRVQQNQTNLKAPSDPRAWNMITHHHYSRYLFIYLPLLCMIEFFSEWTYGNIPMSAEKQLKIPHANQWIMASTKIVVKRL